MNQTGPEESDLEEGAESRICATCQHDEDDHELVEDAAGSHTVCRICDDVHEFEPEPELAEM